jgi:hypothetical protein
MFKSPALSLLVAFLATSAFAQDHSSEQSEAQITGACCLPLTLSPSYQPRCRRSQSRVHAVLLRSLGPVRQRVSPNMAACDATRERLPGPGHVGQHLVQHTDEHSAQGAAQREHHQRDLQWGD